MGIKTMAAPAVRQVKRIVSGGHRPVDVPRKAFPQPSLKAGGMGDSSGNVPAFGGKA